MPPFIACIASLVIPGLGQLLIGQWQKGLVLMLLTFAGVAAMVGHLAPSMCGVGLFNLVIGLDAYLLAKKRSIRSWQWFG